MAVLDKPVWLSMSAPEPTAVLKEPVVLFWSAALPIAVLATPVVLFTSGSSPKNVLARLRSHPSRHVARACGDSAKQASTTATRNTELVRFSRISGFMGIRFVPAELILWNCGSGRDEEPSGRSSPPDSDSI